MKYSYQVLLPVEINIKHNGDEADALYIADRIVIAIKEVVKEKFKQDAVIETICCGEKQEFMI